MNTTQCKRNADVPNYHLRFNVPDDRIGSGVVVVVAVVVAVTGQGVVVVVAVVVAVTGQGVVVVVVAVTGQGVVVMAVVVVVTGQGVVVVMVDDDDKNLGGTLTFFFFT